MPSFSTVGCTNRFEKIKIFYSIEYLPKDKTKNFVWNGCRVQSKLELYHQLEEFLYVIFILMKTVWKRKTFGDNTCSAMPF